MLYIVNFKWNTGLLNNNLIVLCPNKARNFTNINSLKINYHPHIHVLITEGGEDKEGLFHKVSRFDDALIAEFFAQEVFSLLLQKKLISLELVQKILLWRYTDFKVYSRVRATNKREAERVGKYMIRPLLSLGRLSFDETEGKVCYWYGKDASKQEWTVPLKAPENKTELQIWWWSLFSLRCLRASFMTFSSLSLIDFHTFRVIR